MDLDVGHLTAEQRRRLNAILARRDSNLAPSKVRVASPIDRVSMTPSAREIEVLSLVSEGLTSTEISKHLWLSEETIKSHMRHILGKLEACNRAHAVAIAFRRGLIS